MFHHSIYILILYYISNIFSLQSRIYLETAGIVFLPVDINALLLGNWSVATTVACVFKCFNNFECRTFNFDSTTNQCQLFEGDKMATGSMIGAPTNSNSQFIDQLVIKWQQVLWLEHRHRRSLLAQLTYQNQISRIIINHVISVSTLDF